MVIVVSMHVSIKEVVLALPVNGWVFKIGQVGRVRFITLEESEL